MDDSSKDVVSFKDALAAWEVPMTEMESAYFASNMNPLALGANNLTMVIDLAHKNPDMTGDALARAIVLAARRLMERHPLLGACAVKDGEKYHFRQLPAGTKPSVQIYHHKPWQEEVTREMNSAFVMAQPLFRIAVCLEPVSPIAHVILTVQHSICDAGHLKTLAVELWRLTDFICTLEEARSDQVDLDIVRKDLELASRPYPVPREADAFLPGRLRFQDAIDKISFPFEVDSQAMSTQGMGPDKAIRHHPRTPGQSLTGHYMGFTLPGPAAARLREACVAHHVTLVDVLGATLDYAMAETAARTVDRPHWATQVNSLLMVDYRLATSPHVHGAIANSNAHHPSDIRNEQVTATISVPIHEGESIWTIARQMHQAKKQKSTWTYGDILSLQILPAVYWVGERFFDVAAALAAGVISHTHVDPEAYAMASLGTWPRTQGITVDARFVDAIYAVQGSGAHIAVTACNAPFTAEEEATGRPGIRITASFASDVVIQDVTTVMSAWLHLLIKIAEKPTMTSSPSTKAL